MTQAAAGVGSTVRVAGEAGRMIEFELVARRHHHPRGLEVTPTSPVGELLMGARAGDVVRVRLPSGRDRVLRVLDVSSAAYRDVGKRPWIGDAKPV